MYAAVIVSPREARVVEVGPPEPREGEVRIRVEGCGVCASNAPVWEGREWFTYPGEAGNPGHEGWGWVDRVVEGVKGVERGDRVAFLSSRAYAEYDITTADSLVKLPEGLKGRPFPGEPLGCAMNVFRRSRIKEGHTVAIVGVGFLGALLIQLAKAAGARVIAISRRDFSLAIAREWGADHCLKMDNPKEVIERVRGLTNGQFCDRVIEAVGLEAPLDLAGELTRVRGRLVIAGFHQDGPRSVNLQLWNWRGMDVINAHERHPREYARGMEDAVEAVLKGTLDPFPLLTHSYPLQDINRAFHDLVQRPDGFLKGIIEI